MAKITKLWRRKRFSDYDSLFEMEYDKSIMQSERTRAIIVFIISCCSILWFVIVNFFFARYFPSIALVEYRGFDTFEWLALIFGGLALYEFMYGIILMSFLGRKKMFPFFPRFVNAFVEISIPTVMMYLAFNIYHTIEPLLTPVLLMYFIFISLGSLRLNFTLSLFTGMVAGVEYIALSMYILLHIKYDPGYSSLYYPGMHISKGVLLMLVGLVTGLVSLQIKSKMKRSIKTIEEKNRIVSMFGQHVSPEVVNKLLDQKGELNSETRYVCMMFLDIRNFTKFAESRPPEEVVSYLNNLFDFMIDIINENRGIINKFLGDGFMAVFGAPISDGEDSRNAVNAARAILERLERDSGSGTIPETNVGIGIHAGMAVTGHIGSHQRKEYTIIGDVVNLASRIEQLNKKYGSRLLVSEEVWHAIEKSTYTTEDLGSVDIRGHAGTVHIYKLA
jgi:adenylate cyclase